MKLLAVIEAVNGRVALDILEGPQGEAVDIILTDNVMPEVCTLSGHAVSAGRGGLQQRDGIAVVVAGGGEEDRGGGGCGQ